MDLSLAAMISPKDLAVNFDVAESRLSRKNNALDIRPL